MAMQLWKNTERRQNPRECHLQHRQSVCSELKEKARQEYEALVRRDQRVPRRKFFFPDKMHARAGEEVEEAEKHAVKKAR